QPPGYGYPNPGASGQSGPYGYPQGGQQAGYQQPGVYPPPGYQQGAGYAGYAADPNAPYGYDPYGRPLSDKSKIVAGVLQLFLGSFGIGRFYVGSVGVGIAPLLTCGGLGIWALIDGLMYLVSTARTDAQGRSLRGWRRRSRAPWGASAVASRRGPPGGAGGRHGGRGLPVVHRPARARTRPAAVPLPARHRTALPGLRRHPHGLRPHARSVRRGLAGQPGAAAGRAVRAGAVGPLDPGGSARAVVGAAAVPPHAGPHPAVG